MLTLDASNTIIEHALQKAQEMNLPPLSIAVVDQGGHLKSIVRQDNAPFSWPPLPMEKRGALYPWVAPLGKWGRSLSTVPIFSTP